MAGRKPVHLTTAAGRVTGRQAVWQAVRRLKKFTMNDIDGEGLEDRWMVKTYLEALTAAGIIEVTEKKLAPSNFNRYERQHRNSNHYRLVKDSGVDAPRVRRDGTPCTQGLPREQMWRTMRLMATFTWGDLAATASTAEVPVAEVDAASYVGALNRAGYLTIVKPSKPGTQAVYRLTRYTGPRPPMVQRLKTVFDPNLGQIVWHDEVDA